LGSSTFCKVKWYKPKTINARLELSTNCLSQSTLHGCYIQGVYDAIYNSEFEEITPKLDIEQIAEKELSVNNIVDAPEF
jgi:hypothetical protein